MTLADLRTFEALDFLSVRERVVSGTKTQRGRRYASELLPHTDFDDVRREQTYTQAVRSLVVERDFYVMPAIETVELTESAKVGRTLSGLELRAIGDGIAAAAAAYRAAHEHPDLTAVVRAYAPLRELQRALSDAIDERGSVLDRASPALSRLRRNLAQAQAEARDRVSALLNSTKYSKAIQDRLVTIRNGRFVIPIKADFAAAVPGIVHDTSASGQTLFVEPLAALEGNNRVRTLHIEEEREVQRILEGLSREVGRRAPAIDANIDMLAAIDLLAAKAQLAIASGSVAPELREDAAIAIDCGRHPLLDARAVPQSLSIDQTTRVLLISGPNMGGKTVALKMAGLCVVMTYCGLQVPAARASIGRFRRVIADIGDEQSLLANASTFSAHLQRMREILDGADSGTLAIVDEIGGGTEPSAGAALARAMLERLLQSGARAIVSTHSLELKLFAHAASGVANASVRFDPINFSPTFELDVGTAGQSLAFPLAARLGIDTSIIERATELLDRRERDYEAALTEVSLRSNELLQERSRLAAERLQTTRERQTVQRDRAAIDAERRTFVAKAEARLQQSLRDFIRELQRRASESAGDSQSRRKGKVSPAQTGLLAQALESIRRDLGIVSHEERQAADNYSPGERVRVLSLNQEAIVSEDYDERVLVSIGSMKMVVDKSDVRREGGNAAVAPRSSRGGEARLNAAGRATVELDVRGKRYAEAEPVVERWIDDALLAGNASLRLIHGKGTGMLGRGLQEYLRAHSGVQSLRYGNEEEGSSGVTMIELRT